MSEPTPVRKVKSVIFDTDDKLTARAIPGTERKIIIPLRKVRVMTDNGQVWQTNVSAFCHNEEQIKELYGTKRDLAFERLGADDTPQKVPVWTGYEI